MLRQALLQDFVPVQYADAYLRSLQMQELGSLQPQAYLAELSRVVSVPERLQKLDFEWS
jgi:hypothetical protein